MQNLVFLMEPSEDAQNVSLKGGNMCLNRFCIDEDASFELSGVHYLKKSSQNMRNLHRYLAERRSKVKGYSSLSQYAI